MSPGHLPDELLLQIFEIIQTTSDDETAQRCFWACSLTCRQWCRVCTPFLYRQPVLFGAKFDPFVRVICPSINLHIRKSPLSRWIQILDLGRLVHHGSKSVTARLLGRTKDNLVEFVAPQASFAVNCFPALRKCLLLETLNLSLVSETPSLQTLFKAIENLERLKELRLPRSAGFGAEMKEKSLHFPPNLQRLYVSGGVDANFVAGIVDLPLCLRELTLEHCPSLKPIDAVRFLCRIHERDIPLTYLKLAFLPRMHQDPFWGVLPQLLKTLIYLSISVDYLWGDDFPDLTHHTPRDDVPLRVLELTNSGHPDGGEWLDAAEVTLLVQSHFFGDLRQVRVAKSLGWDQPETRQITDDLHDLLHQKEVERPTSRAILRSVARLAKVRCLRAGVFVTPG